MDDLSKVQLRPYAVPKLAGMSNLPKLLRVGKGAVIFCPIDITTGLLGSDTWGIIGYQPAYARSLLKNVVLWAMDGAK